MHKQLTTYILTKQFNIIYICIINLHILTEKFNDIKMFYKHFNIIYKII